MDCIKNNFGRQRPCECEQCKNNDKSESTLNDLLCADELHLTLCDALSGWKYIRYTHGDLYGVGWDRVQERLEAQITLSAKRLGT